MPVKLSSKSTGNQRRQFLIKSSASVASLLLPNINAFAANDLTGRLASYMANARNLELPPNVLKDRSEEHTSELQSH